MEREIWSDREREIERWRERDGDKDGRSKKTQ